MGDPLGVYPIPHRDTTGRVTNLAARPAIQAEIKTALA